MKTCSKCKIEKNITDFGMHKKALKTYHYKCKICTNIDLKIKDKPILDIVDLPDEIWVEVKGYEGLYEISNMCRIKSLKKVFLSKNKTTNDN